MSLYGPYPNLDCVESFVQTATPAEEEIYACREYDVDSLSHPTSR